MIVPAFATPVGRTDAALSGRPVSELGALVDRSLGANDRLGHTASIRYL
jgi:hypothetical protein